MATTTETLNSLLRREISATETYDQALAKLGNEKAAKELQRIRGEHSEFADSLRQQVRSHGGQPEETSGPWGAVARTVEGTATLLGKNATLKVLELSEERIIKQYERALRDEDLPDDTTTLIASSVLPKARAHIPVLDGLIAGMVERIEPPQAREHVQAGEALLVCAYDDEAKCRQFRLEGAISLSDFQSTAASIRRDREIVFYCT